jgi:hypothetical protein
MHTYMHTYMHTHVHTHVHTYRAVPASRAAVKGATAERLLLRVLSFAERCLSLEFAHRFLYVCGKLTKLCT